MRALTETHGLEGTIRARIRLDRLRLGATAQNGNTAESKEDPTGNPFASISHIDLPSQAHP
jgi:hypothetical protein